MTDNSYTVIVQQMQDSDELYFEIPDEVLQRLGWDENTEVEFTVVDDEGFKLTKVDRRDG
jgi:antitoxin component of MazEF toxin-antitoxin module